jgi:hypothetical protein
LARFADPANAAAGAGSTVRVWLHRWLASRLALQAETHRSYGEFISNYLVPYLGSMLVSEVRTRDVQGMFASIIRRHEQVGQPLTPATLQRIYATLRAAFNAAVRAGLIEVNSVRGWSCRQRGLRGRWYGLTSGERSGGETDAAGGGGVDCESGG